MSSPFKRKMFKDTLRRGEKSLQPCGFRFKDALDNSATLPRAHLILNVEKVDFRKVSADVVGKKSVAFSEQ